MLIKDRALLDGPVSALSSDGRILKIVLFGSMVRGDYRGDSDFDVYSSSIRPRTKF